MEKWISYFYHKERTNYEISTEGRIRHTADLRIIPQHKINSGYLKVSLWIDGQQVQKLVHRMVCESYHQQELVGLEVNHIDGNKTNNALTNLEVVTRSENIRHSYEILGNKKAKKVFQYSLLGDLLGEFYSEGEAARVTGAGQAQISRCLAGVALTAGGFQWKSELQSVKPARKTTQKKRVVQKDKEGKILNTYSSIREAARAVGADSGSVSKCCTGHRKTCKGFCWSFELVEDIV
jgi:hypothetical protein